MNFIVSAIYVILFLIFCFFAINKKHMYSSFIFLIFGTRGLSFLPAVSTKVKAFPFFCMLIFCAFNFETVIHNIKHNKVIRSVFYMCIFFAVSMLFSIIVWQLPVYHVLNAGMPYMIPMCIVMFVPLTDQEFHKIFTALFYITFAATVLYIIQCFTGQAILPMSWIQHEQKRGVQIIAGNIYRFWSTPPFMVEFIPISIFCKKIVPKSLRAISPAVFISGLFCTMYRTRITAAILGILFLMYLSGSLRKNFKSIIVLLVIYLAFGATFSERVTRDNNATFRDLSALMRGDFNITGTKAGGGMTLMYRIGWCIERGVYLVNNPAELLMGLPMTSDKKFWYKNYNFKLGLIDEEGYKEQATTPDIAYGMMETRYGLIGSLLLIRMIYLVSKKLYRSRHKSELAMTLLSLIMSTLIASISGTDIAEPLYWVTFFFLYDYAMKMIERGNMISSSANSQALRAKA